MLARQLQRHSIGQLVPQVEHRRVEEEARGGLAEAHPRTELRHSLQRDGLGNRQVDEPGERPPRQCLACSPYPDERRHEDDVTRAAEVRVLLDNQRRLAPLDPEAKGQGGRHDRYEPDRELERLAHVRRTEGREPEVPVRGDVHLQAEVQTEGPHPRQCPCALEQLHAGLDGDPFLGVHEHGLVESRVREESVGRDLPALDEIHEIEDVDGRQAVLVWRHVANGPNSGMRARVGKTRALKETRIHA